MAHNGRNGFLSSFFGKKKQKEEVEAAHLELKHKLEERIRQVLADSVEVPAVLKREETPVALVVQEEEAPEVMVELFPISASVIRSRKAPVQSDFLLSTFETHHSYAANER
jgi:hypothetical protein